MTDLVRYEVHDDVAVVTLNNPPVNALSPGVPEGIYNRLNEAVADEAVKFMEAFEKAFTVFVCA